MKLRNIFTALTAALVLAFAGCQEEERFLDEVQVSESMVALPVAGGSVNVKVNASAEWEFTDVPEWLTVSPASGVAGEIEVTFTAAEAAETREALISLICNGAVQNINVLQMAEKVEVPLTDCATVLAENNVGKVYKVKGTITDLTNYDKYGCFYVNDGTATVYVYGSMNSAQFKPEVGDIITFEGPWTSYGNFDDATIVSLEKSLIKLEKVFPAEALPLEGGVATALLTVKDGDLEVVIPEDATWLTAGEPSVLGGMTSVELTAAANEGGARTTTVTFKVNVDGKDYLAMADIEQLGAITEVSVADFLAAEVGDAQYKVSGILTSVVKAEYGNVYIKDATGELYVYGIGAQGDFEKLGLKVGDIVTLVGKRAEYKGSPQMGGGQYESHKPVTKMNAADVAALADDNKSNPANYIMLTGKVSKPAAAKYDLETFGNFDLVDESGSIYVYGVSTGWNGETKKFASLGVKENDIITIVAYKTSYDGNAQVVGMYVSHEAATEGGEEPETPATTTLTLTNAEILAALTSSSTSYTEYTIASASGEWTVNASQNQGNTYLQCRGKKGAYIKTPLFEKDIKSVTIHFSEAKSVYADNVYCVFPATWTVPTEDAAYPEDGNVGKAVTDGSYSLTIPVDAGNKQVYVSIIGTYAYYLDHIDVAF
ncbi:MAG: BACON domain-containing protein [Bacteroidales bacterium]|nr:BACON domain-containing protein [Bacteroidales bacterium]